MNKKIMPGLDFPGAMLGRLRTEYAGHVDGEETLQLDSSVIESNSMNY